MRDHLIIHPSEVIQEIFLNIPFIKSIPIVFVWLQPIETGYRNKAEFTIGKSIDGTGESVA